jgi:methylglutaconyl-CoA hydratase
MASEILIEKINPQTTAITLNRPEKRNALSLSLMDTLCNTLEEVHKDASQRILLFRGAGPAFCTGLDLEEVADLTKSHASAFAVAKLLKTIYSSPCITIAAVQGAAVAGGAGILSACDFALAAEGSQFGFPEVRRGLVAAIVMTLLHHQLQERHLKELLFLGELIDARKAQEIGLINRVVPQEELLKEAEKTAKSCLKGGPKAMILTKRLLTKDLCTEIDEVLKYHLEVRQSEEAEEGIKAFFEKRNASWVPAESR